jgi:hypothetical protein
MWQSLSHQQVYCSIWRIRDTIEEYAIDSLFVLLAPLIHSKFVNHHSSFLPLSIIFVLSLLQLWILLFILLLFSFVLQATLLLIVLV